MIGVVALALAAGAQVQFAADVVLPGRSVTLGDVADLTPLPAKLRTAAKDLVIVRIPPGRDTIQLADRDIARRAVGLMPALAPWFERPSSAQVAVRVTSSDRGGPVAKPACAVVRSPLHPGMAALASDLAPTACPGGRPGLAFHYDAHRGVAWAAGDLHPGDVVAAPPHRSLALARDGDLVTLTVRFGPVTVSRRVEAVQPVLSDAAVFVRSDNGDVFSAPAREVSP